MTIDNHYIYISAWRPVLASCSGIAVRWDPALVESSKPAEVFNAQHPCRYLQELAERGDFMSQVRS